MRTAVLHRSLLTLLLTGGALGFATPALAQKKPAKAAPATQKAGPLNILVIYGDDIGQTNISAYSMGVMGYRTPNIDRIAKEGMLFTDYYAEQSCTAGRSTFITGQVTLRTGLSKVGLPGSDLGLQPQDVTIAQVLKSMGYATGQFGKNHLGDKDEFLPTNHGFDEFLGNLYHLNAEEEPENVDYPKDPAFRKQFGPRGVIHSWALPGGGQKIEDTGPLTIKRMETVDDETTAAAIDFMQRQVKGGKPFFVWMNTTRMHFRTHVPASFAGKSGINFYDDGMLQHDADVGKLLKALDDLGIADNTLLIYTTDNGPHQNSWPDAGTTPFRSEKNTNWEGAFRVPALIRWPGHVKPGSVSNDIVSGLDWFPTLIAAAGDAGITDKLLAGASIGGTSFKVHLDGYNITPLLEGTGPTPRKDFFYFNDDAQLVAMRYGMWKLVFCEQRATGTMQIWAEPFTCLRVPKIFNLRLDPYERADQTSNTYYDWLLDRAFLLVPAQAYAGQFLGTFKDYPPRQKSAAFNLSKVTEMLQSGVE
jgi:arylsulfatase A-like enzyme